MRKDTGKLPAKADKLIFDKSCSLITKTMGREQEKPTQRLPQDKRTKIETMRRKVIRGEMFIGISLRGYNYGWHPIG